MQMTMKKLIACTLALALMLALLAGCGSKPETKPADEPAAQAGQDAAQTAEQPAEEQEAQAEQETQAEQEAQADEKDAVDPYAWMGLEDMPRCNYLNIMSTNNFVQVYDTYVLGIKAEVTDACKGLKTYQKNQSTLTYNIEGMIYSINTDSKQYAQYDMTASIEGAEETMKTAIAEGINTKGRAFQGTGKSAIPLYSDEEGDSAEYEYYEYMTGEADGNNVIERFYLKDGDVFAIYSKTHVGETDLESTNVIKSISADVPDDLFVVPDLTDYTKIN